jgi:integrase
VRHQLQRVNGTLALVAPKSDKSIRTVALPPVVIDALSAHRASQNRERLRTGKKKAVSAFVFTTRGGEPVDRFVAIRYFRRALERAGLPMIRFHDLRHTAATLMLEQGVPLSTVSAILGHSGIQITADLYGHVLASMKHTAAAKIAAALD